MVHMQEGRAGSPADEEVIRPAVPCIDSPPIPHTGDEPEYVQFRSILESGDRAKAGEFFRQHPDLQLAPLVANCSTKHFVNLLPLLNLNRHHSRFDRQIHAEMQCRVLHHLLDQALSPQYLSTSPHVTEMPQTRKAQREIHWTLVLDVMNDFLRENHDLDVARFLPGCKTFESTPEAKGRERDKKEAILPYMQPDHPLYENLKYHDLGHPVDDDAVNRLRDFLIANPQSKQAILEYFAIRASDEQLETVLPHIHLENKYRTAIQQKVAAYFVQEKESDEVISFVAEEKDKNLDLASVWLSTIYAGRADVANDLEQSGFAPPRESLERLLADARRLERTDIAEVLEFIIADQDSDPMDVDSDSRSGLSPR